MIQPRQSRVEIDWPFLIGFGAPVPAGIGFGLMSSAVEWDDGLAVFIALFLLVIPASIAISYWLSCRVADRSGQPWAFISFWIALADWWLGIAMYFAFAGTFNNK